MRTPSKSTVKSRRPARSKLLQVVEDHPVATVRIAGAAVMGAVLAKKAMDAAAKVVTIKAAAKAAAEVTRAARGKR